MDPNVLKLEKSKHIIWGAVPGGVVLGALVLLLLYMLHLLLLLQGENYTVGVR